MVLPKIPSQATTWLWFGSGSWPDTEGYLAFSASWHAIRLEVGPYLVEGEMPTFPGFDPGRALTRPTGDFVLLRDVRVGPRDSPDPLASSDTVGQHALVNRYGVESVACDLMLGFFFPGAAMIQADVAEAGAT